MKYMNLQTLGETNWLVQADEFIRYFRSIFIVTIVKKMAGVFQMYEYVVHH